MSSIVELMKGEGGADTIVRAILLALVLGVSAALVWTTVGLREPHRRPAEAAIVAPAQATTTPPAAGRPLASALH